MGWIARADLLPYIGGDPWVICSPGFLMGLSVLGEVASCAARHRAGRLARSGGCILGCAQEIAQWGKRFGARWRSSPTEHADGARGRSTETEHGELGGTETGEGWGRERRQG